MRLRLFKTNLSPFFSGFHTVFTVQSTPAPPSRKPSPFGSSSSPQPEVYSFCAVDAFADTDSWQDAEEDDDFSAPRALARNTSWRFDTAAVVAIFDASVAVPRKPTTTKQEFSPLMTNAQPTNHAAERPRLLLTLRKRRWAKEQGGRRRTTNRTRSQSRQVMWMSLSLLLPRRPRQPQPSILRQRRVEVRGLRSMKTPLLQAHTPLASQRLKIRLLTFNTHVFLQITHVFFTPLLQAHTPLASQRLKIRLLTFNTHVFLQITHVFFTPLFFTIIYHKFSTLRTYFTDFIP